MEFQSPCGVTLEESMFINEPLTKAAQDGLDARPMAHTISSFFQCCHVHFDSGTRQLIKVKRGVPRTLSQPEEKITQHALVDVDGSWTLTGETGFAIRTDPDTIVRPLRKCYQVGSLRHYPSGKLAEGSDANAGSRASCPNLRPNFYRAKVRTNFHFFWIFHDSILFYSTYDVLQIS